MAPRPVRTSRRVGDTTLHLHQVVRDAAGWDWIIISLEDDVGLLSVDLAHNRTVSVEEFAARDFTPVFANDVPVWGY